MKYLAILAALLAGLLAADAFGASNKSMLAAIPDGATGYVDQVSLSMNLAVQPHKVHVIPHEGNGCVTVHTNEMYFVGEKVRVAYYFHNKWDRCGQRMFTILIFREP